MEIPSEFASRVSVSENGCWIWTGWVAPKLGGTGSHAPYGCIQRNKKILKAHRYFYELATGEHPGEQHVHHKCRNTLCVNPDHLEVLPQGDHNRIHDAFGDLNSANLARETCSRGHPWSAETIYWWRGIRHCRACSKERMRDWREARGLTGKPKTHCPQGHPYEGENLRLTSAGHRLCRACNRERSKEAQRRYRAKRAANPPP